MSERVLDNNLERNVLLLKCLVKGLYHACNFSVEVGEVFVARRNRSCKTIDDNGSC